MPRGGKQETKATSSRADATRGDAVGLTGALLPAGRRWGTIAEDASLPPGLARVRSFLLQLGIGDMQGRVDDAC